MVADRQPLALTWPSITTTATALAEQARTDGVPDLVVGVLRGGMIPAVLVAHSLGVRTVRAVEVVHTVADGVDAAKSVCPQLTNEASLGRLVGRDVLIVDDIAGSGDTIDCVVDLVHAAGPVRVRTAICVVNVANWRRPQPPDQMLTYVGAAVEGWVIFPWESR